MVTGVYEHVTPQNNNHSVPTHPSRAPTTDTDSTIQQLINALGSINKSPNKAPRIQKALTTTMPTFDGKNEKFELFEDLFNTNLTAYPNIKDSEKKTTSTPC